MPPTAPPLLHPAHLESRLANPANPNNRLFPVVNTGGREFCLSRFRQPPLSKDLFATAITNLANPTVENEAVEALEAASETSGLGHVATFGFI